MGRDDNMRNQREGRGGKHTRKRMMRVTKKNMNNRKVKKGNMKEKAKKEIMGSEKGIHV